MTPGAEGFVPAPPYPDEEGRLAALRDYGVLDSVAEPVFDDIVFLASYICGTPIAMVSLVDEGRQWFKARVGIDVQETSRDVAFCAHAILEPDKILVVEDALEDPRFAANPLVRESPKIRFYAGAPLNSPDGMPLGTICAMDHVPRLLSAEQGRALGALSREVVVHLELRRAVAALAGPNEGLLAPELGTEVRDELREASQSASSASALIAEAMERVLESEKRMRSLLYRVQTVQRRPTPRVL
jgi:GAF domain-containing protein